MIIPIRCFTCGKVIADKWEYYIKKCEELENENNNKKDNKYFTEPFKETILNDLKLNKYCCRRMLLSHVDIVDNL